MSAVQFSDDIRLCTTHLKQITKNSFEALCIADALATQFKRLGSYEREYTYNRWCMYNKNVKKNSCYEFYYNDSQFIEYVCNLLDTMQAHKLHITSEFNLVIEDLVAEYKGTKIKADLKAIGLAIAYGIYASIVFVDAPKKKTWMMFAARLAAILPKLHREAFVFHAYMVFGLTQNGYFSEVDVVNFLEMFSKRTPFGENLQKILDLSKDEFVLFQNTPPELEYRTPHEKALCYSVFYLLKIAKNDRNIVRPADLVAYVVGLDIDFYKEFLVTFFMLLTLSEQNVFIFPKIFKTSIPKTREFQKILHAI